MNLYNFVKESWKIEGLNLDEAPDKDTILWLHEMFIASREVTTHELAKLAINFTEDGRLRDRNGMDVIVGNHRPFPGGFIIRQMLDDLVEDVMSGPNTPDFAYKIHCRFETLHPFMDGNGRTGRALWAWMMNKSEDRMWIERGFLHTWYYQSLRREQTNKSI